MPHADGATQVTSGKESVAMATDCNEDTIYGKGVYHALCS